MPKESIRTFIALEIDEITKEKIIQLQEKIIQVNSLKASWVTKENIHLTLKFLGDTQLKHIPQIKDVIKKCLDGERAISCNLNAIGVFPSERFPRIVWVGIEEGKAQIIHLAKKLEGSLFKLGHKKEKREFKSHITISRAKQLLNFNQFKSQIKEINKTFPQIEFTINKIILFKSQLTPKGPIYIDLFSRILQ